MSNSDAVYRIPPSGSLVPFAGGGSIDGDGIPAVLAQLGAILDLASDQAGNIFILELVDRVVVIPNGTTVNTTYRVRRVSPDGVISTVVSFSTVDPNLPWQFLGITPSWSVVVASKGIVASVAADGAVTTIAGGGKSYLGPTSPAINAKDAALFLDRIGFAIAGDGTIYLSGPGVPGAVVAKLTVAPTCVYTLSPGNKGSVPSTGSGGVPLSLTVTTSDQRCPWAPASDSSWIAFIDGSPRTGNGTIQYVVTANTGSAARTGSIKVAGATIQISQAPQGADICVYDTSLDGQVFGPSGGASIVNVVTDPLCLWSSASTVSWISLTQSGTGSGNGTVGYSVAQNAGSGRMATIQIAGKTFSVTQAPNVGAASPVMISKVVNAASGVGGLIAPGEFIVVYGSSLNQAALSSQLASPVGNTRLLINGVPALLSYVSPTQIDALVPDNLSVGGLATISADYQSQPSNNLTLSAAPASPGIFSLDGSGKGPAVAVNQDGSLNSAMNPASKGSIISIFATGQGLTVPPAANAPPPAFPVPALPLTVLIGGSSVSPNDLLFSGLVFPGVLQINVRVPIGLQGAGNVEIRVGVGQSMSPAGVSLAVN